MWADHDDLLADHQNQNRCHLILMMMMMMMSLEQGNVEK